MPFLSLRWTWHVRKPDLDSSANTLASIVSNKTTRPGNKDSDIDTTAHTFSKNPQLPIPPSSLDTKNATNTKKEGMKSTKIHKPVRRWSRSYLNHLMHAHRPRNLPEDVIHTDKTNVQDLPLRDLVPELTLVEAQNQSQGWSEDGPDTVVFAAGSRVDVPLSTHIGRAGLALPVPVSVSNARGEDTAPKSMSSSLTTPPVMAKRTPFQLVIRDRHGNIKVDMSWTADVAGHAHAQDQADDDGDDHMVL